MRSLFDCVGNERAIALSLNYGISREEIEAMFGLSDLKQTRFYQEAKQEGKEEGKLESVPGFLAIGLSVEQIAKALGLDVEIVRQAAQAAGGDSSEG